MSRRQAVVPVSVRPGKPATLIVGGGIEGMSAALLLAESGQPVTLVERAPWIGGSLHLLDRTFPTDSCGLCLMAPVQPAYCPTYECHLHRNITVLTDASIAAVTGEVGAWRIAVRRRPRAVMDERCNRCGLCLDACPVSRPALYEGDLSPQKAIYRPPARAVPDVPVIDATYCTRCGQCVTVCPHGAIDLNAPERSEIVEAAAVVLAPGYEPFDARLKGEYGYGLYRNVVTSLQFERMTSAAGSTVGRIVRPSDGRTPRRIAFIQCVGSRDATCAREYCSSVCCMYTAKQVAAAKMALPDLEATVFYIDLRAGGKGYEGYLDSVLALPGVTYWRSMVSSVIEKQRTGNLLLAAVGPDGRIVEQEFDLLVLAVGLSPATEMREAAAHWAVDLDVFGFARSETPGVFVGGAFREPMDVPETVVDSAAVAARVIAFLSTLSKERAQKADPPAGRDISPAPPDIGPAQVGVLFHLEGEGGARSVPPIDLDSLLNYTAKLPSVVLARWVRGTEIDLMASSAAASAGAAVNRWVIVSVAGPMARERVQAVADRMGLPAGAMEWVAWHGGAAAQSRLRVEVAMAVARVSEDRGTRRPDAPVAPPRREQRTLIVGGGLAGLSAALVLAKLGLPVALVERSGMLGGQARELRSLLDGGDPRRIVDDLVTRVQATPDIQVFARAHIMEVTGHAGAFVTMLPHAGQTVRIEHGAMIVAVGADEAMPRDYEYGRHPAILTQRELEGRLADHADALREVRRVVMIQCVESRDEQRPYCSRICCGQAVKNALALRAREPEIQVFVLYRDVRMPGLQELAYQRARQQGVRFLRYDLPAKPVVRSAGSGLVVELVEPLLGRKVALPADWVVLSVGIQATDQSELAQTLGVPLDGDSFFKEAHPKMQPLDLPRPGMYACGLAHGPCSLPESIAQGQAAAMRAAAFLAHEPSTRAHVAAVSDRLCCGCGLCVTECPYGARVLDRNRAKARVLESLCLGCGACAVVCRNGATRHLGQEKARVMAAIDAAFT